MLSLATYKMRLSQRGSQVTKRRQAVIFKAGQRTTGIGEIGEIAIGNEISPRLVLLQLCSGRVSARARVRARVVRW